MKYHVPYLGIITARKVSPKQVDILVNKGILTNYVERLSKLGSIVFVSVKNKNNILFVDAQRYIQNGYKLKKTQFQGFILKDSIKNLEVLPGT